MKSHFVEDMRASIQLALSPFEGQRIGYVYPLQTNTGDHLIRAGSLEALKKFNIIDCSPWTPSPDKLDQIDTILVQGGGNFGSRYRPYAKAWLNVVSNHPRKNIVFLPHSVWWESDNLKKADLDVLRNHKSLIFMARETGSFSILKNELKDVQLFPDFAYAFDKLKAAPSETGPVVEIIRADKERVGDEPIGRDWGGPRNVLQAIARANQKLDGVRLVITDRLHVHIICSLQGIPNILTCNAYHKNESYFSTWTWRDGISKFASTWKEARELACE